MGGIQYNQLNDDVVRSKIGSLTGEQLDNQMSLIEDKLNLPLDVTLSGTVLTIEPSIKQKLESDGADSTQNQYKWRVPHLSGIEVNTAQSTIDLTDGSVTGDFLNPPSSVSMTASYYIQMGIEYRTDGKFHVVWGIEAATKVGAQANYPAFSKKKALPVLLAILQDDGTGGTWNFSTPAKEDIAKFPVGSGGGGGGGDGAFYEFAIRQEQGNFAFRAEQYFESIATIDSDNLVNAGASSATDESIAGGRFLFDTIGDYLVTNSLLGNQFLLEKQPIGKGEVALLYEYGAVDVAPKVEVSPDGGNTWVDCNARQVKSTLSNLNSEVASFSTLGSDTSTELTDAASGAGKYLAQSFQVSSNCIVSNILLRLLRAGTPGGTVRVKIYNDDAGAPNETFAVSKAVTISDIPLTASNIKFEFSEDAMLRTGTTYWVALEIVSGYTYSAGVDYVAWKLNDAGGYANGKASAYNSSSALWVDYDSGNDDFIFEIKADTITASELTGVLGEFNIDGTNTYEASTGGTDQDITSAGDYNKIAQTIQVPVKSLLTKLNLSLKKIGNPAGTFKVGIYSTLGGTALDESLDYSIDSLTTSYQDFEIILQNGVILDATTDYYIVLETTGYTYSSGVTELNVQYDNGGTYGNNRWYYPASVWTEQSGSDYKFKLYVNNVDLLLKVTGRTLNASLKAFGIFWKDDEIETISTNSNYERHYVTATEASTLKVYPSKVNFTAGEGQIIVFKGGHAFSQYNGLVEMDGYLLFDSGLLSEGDYIEIRKVDGLYGNSINEKYLARLRVNEYVIVGSSSYADFPTTQLADAIANCPANKKVFVEEDVTTTGITITGKSSRFTLEFAPGIGLIKSGTATGSKAIEFVDCPNGVEVIGGHHKNWDESGDYVFYFSGTTNLVLLDRQYYENCNTPPTNISSLSNYWEGSYIDL